MSATPMKLEDALRLNGYTIDPYESTAVTINAPAGAIVIPPMVLSKLTWRRDGEAPLNGALYLDKLPVFDAAYRPFQLSLILDRFRGRRLGYDTLDEFGVAVRRWGAVNLGPMSVINRRYLSTATNLPLTDVDMLYNTTAQQSAEKTATSDDTAATTTTATGTDAVSSTDSSTSNAKGRDAQSDFPQGQLAGSLDYASGAVDRVNQGTVAGSGSTDASRTANGSTTSEDHKSESASESENRSETRAEVGRSGRSVMELLEQQRASFVNVDEEFLSAFGSLFLGVYDLPEQEPRDFLSFGYPSQNVFGW